MEHGRTLDPHASSPLGWQGASLAGPTRSAERNSLDPSHRCSLARSASSLSTVPDLPSALPEVGYRGRARKRSCNASPTPPRARRTTDLLRVRPPGLHGHPTQVFVRWLLVPGRSIRGGRPRCRANPLWPRGNRRRARLRASSVSTSSWGLGYPPAGRRRGPRSGRRPSPLSHPGRAR